MAMINYMKGKVEEFEKYLDQEIAILENPNITYYIVYDFIETMVRRVRLWINQQAHLPPENLPEQFRQEYLEARNYYLSKVEDDLTHHSRKYDPMDGSVWEDVSKELSNLALFVKHLRENVTKSVP